MPRITRRSLICAAAAAPALSALERGAQKPDTPFRIRTHPLEGIPREELKITDVRVTLLSYELKDKAWFTATQLIWKADCVLVEIFTDSGIVGIGESSPYGGPEWIKKTIEDYVKPSLIGKNPFDVEHLATGWSGQRPGYLPWAGIDAAMWDIIGKAKGMPV